MDTETKKKLDIFFTQFKSQKLNKGEVFLRAEENPSGVFYLTKGEVKQYVISRKGDEVVVNIFKPVSFFPVSIVLTNKPNIYFYEAMSDCEVNIAPKEDVKNFLQKNTDVLYDLLKRMYSGLEGLLTRMIYLMSGDAYPRLLAELIILAKRFGEKDEKTGVVRVKLMEKDIAAQTGMARETVSREMKTLKQRNLIEFHKNVVIINDLQNLEQELNNY